MNMVQTKYETQSVKVETVLAWAKSGEIAIPEIQRPFVWNTTQVRNLLDSLFRGYPVGYLIIWQNPDVRLKDGSRSTGRKILIDGQQRVTALMAAILGHEVVNKDYSPIRIRVAFDPTADFDDPQSRVFEVTNPAIERDAVWIADVSELFGPNFNQYRYVQSYCARNINADPETIHNAVTRLKGMMYNLIGVIYLSDALDIETVAEIFVRVNSSGVELSQADFAMSKIAVNHTHDGPTLRKAIDYFCRLAIVPGEYRTIERNDRDFSRTPYFAAMRWLREEREDLYDPSYSDMLRVIFGAKFGRGRLADFVALLSGRNFLTKQYEEPILEDTFRRLGEGIMDFANETHFKQFIMIIKSAGYIAPFMISSTMSLNFAYILYLRLRAKGVPPADIERHVRRWFVLSLLTGRYSGSPESTINEDIQQIDGVGIESFVETNVRGSLSDAFWEFLLPKAMETSNVNSPYFDAYRAAQVKHNDLGFLSADITVRDLLENASEVHHVFPRDILKRAGYSRSVYNQIANYVVTQSEINRQISNKPPATYFREIWEQVNGGARRYGNIADPDQLRANLAMHCIPDGVENMAVEDYPAFLAARRALMAQKIKAYFASL